MARPKTFEREEILEKAMNLFWKQGYYATSMDDLVKYVGINRASIYNSFGNKKAIFNQAFAYYKRINHQRLRDLFESQSSIKEGFRQLFAQAITTCQQDPENKGCFVVNNVTELANKDPEMFSLLAQNKKEMEELFATYLREGQKTGEIAEVHKVEHLASFLFTVYSGLKVMEKLQPTRDNLEGMVSTALSVLEN